MATTLDPFPPPLTSNISLGFVGGAGQASMTGICVQPGDRIFNVCAIPENNGNVVPDGSPGAGTGYMPHWCYRPYWARTQDLADPPKDPRLIDGLNGNAGIGPAIRVDLEQLYCPWAGVVTLEGGATPLGQAAPTVLQIAYGWDQSGRQRQRWEETVAELWRRVMTMVTARAPYAAGPPLKVMRFPVDMRTSPDNNGHTLTFYNNVDGGGHAMPITRPVMATSVWTPDAQGLVLDNGPGTTSAIVNVNGQSNRAPLGPFSRVTAQSGTASCIIFGINF